MSGAIGLDFSRLVPHALPEDEPAIAPSPIAVSGGLKPTPQQAAFLSALTTTTRNITLCARAGTGKTSSILMGVDTYLTQFPSHELLICAYNKSIQLEIEAKLKARNYDWRQVGCQTVHSMGMGLLKFTYRPKVNEKKVWGLIDLRKDNLPRTSPYWAYGSQIQSLVSLGKQAGVGFFDEFPIGDRSVWYELADHFDIDFDGTCDIDAVVTCAQEVYRQSLEITDEIDFDDMVLMPLVKSIRVKYTKDLILGDEAQDWSRARQALVRKFVRPHTGRLVIVGDEKQAIYGWTGADSDAMDNLTQALDAVTLPLSVSWRCPKAVIALAQQLVPDIEAAPSAPEGKVLSQPELITRGERESGAYDTLPTKTAINLDDLIPGQDVILCRNNAPLVHLAYKLIRAGVPAKVEGRKIGEGLQALVERWKCRSTADLLARLQDYREREVQRFLSKGQEAKAQEAEDRVDTLREIIGEVNRRGKRDIQSVLEFIDNLFADGAKACVTLATYHKSKGKEWERVFLFEHYERCPSRMARQEWQKTGEENLAYVAFTRAKNTLVFVG